FISSFIIFAVTLVFNLYIIPHTNEMKVTFENVYVDPKEDKSKMYTHMQLDKNTYVYIENYDNSTDVGYRFSLEKFKGRDLIEKLIAERISWDSVKKSWKIQNYSIRKINGLEEQMISGVEKDTTLDRRQIDCAVYENVYETKDMSELNSRIGKEKIRGPGILVNLRLEKYGRFVYPLSAFVLTLMGVSLSSRKVRGGIGLPLGI